MSALKESIEKKLAELRYNCGLQRVHVMHAFDRKWGDGKYWDDLQAKAQEERPKDVEAADKALADFIAESRPIMGPEWIGNDHGRLCWASYLGGMPINQHYCQREEGHEGNHADEWPETRWACNHPRGSWPQGVTGDREWRDLIDNTKAQAEAAV